MQFTPGQMRTAINISPETYRHWKKSLSPMSRSKGHSPCFTSGDLVAVGVVKILCVDMGVRVSAISQCAEKLFRICNSAPWPTLERGKLLINLADGELSFRQSMNNVLPEDPHFVVPLRLVVEQLRNKLLSVEGIENQHTLQFPPTPITGVKANAGLGGKK